MLFIKPFTQLNKDHASIAGGKGASLGEMTQAGIPVPPGFVVLAQAFERFCEEEDLIQEIDAILDTVNTEATHTVEKASEQIQSLILAKPIPEDLSEEIIKSFKELNTEYVAVRSSATSEDSADAAWAGQLDSFLNTTEKDLLNNVKRCWASLFTPRAIFYRFEKNLHDQFISVAVVIQKMVNSEKSGIAFSVHPVTEDRNQLIIEAGFGLGEAIVSGQITPDSYVITKDPREIIDINVSNQAKALYRKSNQGGNEWQDLGEDGQKQVLTKEQILALTDIILTIENHYQFPCDIEWATEDDTFYIVQSRPITTLIGNRANIMFEFEYQREAPISLFYVWFYGHTWAHKHLLNMDLELAEKVFAINDSGIWKAYTQEKNLSKIKERINTLEDDSLLHTIETYTDDFRSLEEDNNLVLDKDFISQVIGRFIVVFILGDMEHPLQKQALQARTETEKLFYFIWDVLQKKAQDKKTFPFYSYDEIVSETRLSIKILSKRNRSLLTNRGVIPFSRSNLVNYLTDQNIKLIEYSGERVDDELKGQVAMPGRVIGKVKIILKKSEIKKVLKGDILVSTMTTPDFLPAMKRASALITDEGGITSHAAIISRELKKPCVIGTKIATKVLKDEDEVEVDADNGVVRIIKE